MTENERAVIAAAKSWSDHPSESRARALHEAVARLKSDTCPATAIGGDPAWPRRYTCERRNGHGHEHEDRVFGAWRMAQ